MSRRRRQVTPYGLDGTVGAACSTRAPTEERPERAAWVNLKRRADHALVRRALTGGGPSRDRSFGATGRNGTPVLARIARSNIVAASNLIRIHPIEKCASVLAGNSASTISVRC